MSFLKGLCDLMFGQPTPRSVRQVDRYTFEVDLNGRTYCLDTETAVYRHPAGYGCIIYRRSVREIVGSNLKNVRLRVTPEVASAVIAKLVSHLEASGTRYELA